LLQLANPFFVLGHGAVFAEYFGSFFEKGFFPAQGGIRMNALSFGYLANGFITF
jgi:hypothetical protein